MERQQTNQQRNFALDADHRLKDQFGETARAVVTVNGTRFRLEPEARSDLAEPYVIPFICRAFDDGNVSICGVRYERSSSTAGQEVVTSALRKIEMANGDTVIVTHVDRSRFPLTIRGSRSIRVGLDHK